VPESPIEAHRLVAHRLVYHSTLGLRVIKRRRERSCLSRQSRRDERWLQGGRSVQPCPTPRERQQVTSPVPRRERDNRLRALSHAERETTGYEPFDWGEGKLNQQIQKEINKLKIYCFLARRTNQLMRHVMNHAVSRVRTGERGGKAASLFHLIDSIPQKRPSKILPVQPLVCNSLKVRKGSNAKPDLRWNV